MSDKSMPYTGLFDLPYYTDIVQGVSQVIDIPEKEIHQRLFWEALEPGWNVTRAAQEFGVTPHIYNSLMEEFYKQTDAFIFELLVGHLNCYCQEIDRRVMESVEQYCNGHNKLKILVLGDGIGTDSLRFATMENDVTYFEFEGQSSALAIYRFKRKGVDNQIAVIHRPEEIPTEWFDVLVSREVLEHVIDPPSVIENIWGYLRNDGIAIVTESFGRIEPAFPIHLAKNKKFDGKTEVLFVETGFYLVKSFPERRPMVFRKTKTSDQARFKSLRSYKDYRLGGMVRRFGRYLFQHIKNS